MIRIFLLGILIFLSNASSAQNNNLVASVPEIEIFRDDLVATLYLDYNAFAGWGSQLWNVGVDGKDHCGYLIEWWPDPSELDDLPLHLYTIPGSNPPIQATASQPFRMVTPNHVVQIQPIANEVLYHLRVYALNGLGEKCSSVSSHSFNGGDGTRVEQHRNTLTFFDDFNRPEGPADELKWNNAMAPQTDPRFNLFFINSQYHTHTLNGTLNGGAGDKSQVAQRARKPIVIEEGVRRNIVFDMDGIFSPRGVWYLDLNPVKTDLTGHMSFFDTDGDTGLPADVLRLRSVGHKLSVNLINSEGVSFQVASAHLPDYGRAMAPNVRRKFNLKIGVDGIEIGVDGVSVINAEFNEGVFKPGVYDLLWSTIGYNSSKDDNPYFLSHWDNFGFDGPDAEPNIIHNYVTRIGGSDLQKASEFWSLHPEYIINVPDDIRPLNSVEKAEVYLVFTYMKNDFSTFNISEGDYFTVNGSEFPLPAASNNSFPSNPDLVDYAGSAISNRVKIGEAAYNEASPLIQGENHFQFFATNTGIINVHVEIIYPQGASVPPYTPPSVIHPFTYHRDLPKLGMPARITFIDGEEINQDDQSFLNGPAVSDTMQIEILIGNTHWASWGPHYLNMPAESAEIWSTGNAAGISEVNLYIKKVGEDSSAVQLIKTLHTDIDAPSPQLRYTFKIDSKMFANGAYELFLQSKDSKGYKSHPAYHGFAFLFDVNEISGAYWPVIIQIQNQVPSSYIFEGSSSNDWMDEDNWQNQAIPPSGYNGLIQINENCEMVAGHSLSLGPGAHLVIKENKVLTIKE